MHFLKPTLLALSALAMSGLVPALAGAQCGSRSDLKAPGPA
jgi:hypothetical protein